jgi:hypothetical protein
VRESKRKGEREKEREREIERERESRRRRDSHLVRKRIDRYFKNVNVNEKAR